MLDYERLYRILFNGITDALSNMEEEDYVTAKETLIRSQQQAEDYYIFAEENGQYVPDPSETALPVIPIYTARRFMPDS